MSFLESKKLQVNGEGGKSYATFSRDTSLTTQNPNNLVIKVDTSVYDIKDLDQSYYKNDEPGATIQGGFTIKNSGLISFIDKVNKGQVDKENHFLNFLKDNNLLAEKNGKYSLKIPKLNLSVCDARNESACRHEESHLNFDYNKSKEVALGYSLDKLIYGFTQIASNGYKYIGIDTRSREQFETFINEMQARVVGGELNFNLNVPRTTEELARNIGKYLKSDGRISPQEVILSEDKRYLMVLFNGKAFLYFGFGEGESLAKASNSMSTLTALPVDYNKQTGEILYNGEKISSFDLKRCKYLDYENDVRLCKMEALK